LPQNGIAGLVMHVYPENPWPAAKTVPTETPILGAIVRQEAPENRSDADRIEKSVAQPDKRDDFGFDGGGINTDIWEIV
jgi:hypothetical protein